MVYRRNGNVGCQEQRDSNVAERSERERENEREEDETGRREAGNILAGKEKQRGKVEDNKREKRKRVIIIYEKALECDKVCKTPKYNDCNKMSGILAAVVLLLLLLLLVLLLVLVLLLPFFFFFFFFFFF